jgi:phosphoglycerate dehydrogenase-like enzyme
MSAADVKSLLDQIEELKKQNAALESATQQQKRTSVCIAVLADPTDDSLTILDQLPSNAKVVAIGQTKEAILKNDVSEVEILLRCDGDGYVVESLMPSMPKLKWIHTRSNGVDSLLKSEVVRDSSIPVTNSRGAYSRSLAEYTISACLYFAKDMNRLRAQQKQAKWEKFPMRELHKATLGIIGYGDIGKTTAKLAQAFGMKVIALRRRPELSANDPLINHCYKPDQICELIAQSDYLLVAAALTPQTKGLVGAKEIAAMKPTGVLVNVSRGPIVDSQALLEALRQNKIAGAALDVFEQEPLPSDHGFYKQDNLLMSPHNADIVEGFRHEALELFVENAKRFLDGTELLNVVDKQLGY